MNRQALVRYLSGEVQLPAPEVDRIVQAFTEAIEARGDATPDAEVDIDVGALTRAIVERTMLPRSQVERTIEAMLELRARLGDDATDPP